MPRPLVTLKTAERMLIAMKPTMPIPARLKVIYDGVRELIATHSPDAVALETAGFHATPRGLRIRR